MMKQRCWELYQNLHKYKCYFELYKNEAVRRDKIIRIIISFTSSASVAAWFIWDRLEIIWGIILIISSILHIIKPFLNYEKRILAVDYMLSDLKKILIDLNHFYESIQINNIADAEINDKMREIRQIYEDLESKFRHTTANSPQNSTLMNKAKENSKKELSILP